MSASVEDDERRGRTAVLVGVKARLKVQVQVRVKARVKAWQ